MEITIDEVAYFAYADVPTADAYLAADSNAAAWRAADDITKQRALITATRILDRQSWKSDLDQASRALLEPIVHATAELAAQLVAGYDAANRQHTGQAVRRQKAGSVEIEYFRGAEGSPLRLPLPVWELIKPYLAGASAALGGSIAYGTDGCSIADIGNPYDLTGWVGHSYGWPDSC